MLVSTSDNSDTNDNRSRNSIGKVIFSKTEKYVQDSKGARAHGYIKGNYRDSISQGQNLVLFSREDDIKFYVKVEKIENYPITSAGFETMITETATRLQLQPFYEISKMDNYRGKYRPHSLNGFELDYPNKDELFEITNIPKEGLALGTVSSHGNNIPFNYPLHPEDTIFQSFFIAGVQGSGKTNFTKLLIQAINSKTKTASVILDREGEYSKFVQLDEMSQDGQKFFSNHELKPITPNVLKLSNDFFEANACMSIQGINPTDLLMILPELETKSAGVLKTIVPRAIHNIQQRGEEMEWKNLEKEILLELQTSQFLTGMAGSAIKGAIERALISHNLVLFDQNNKTKLISETLFKEGTVTIIDCQTLSAEQQRMVALYLLLMLNKHKLHEKNIDPGVLLFIDEAEVLFPVKPTSGEREHVLRLSEMIREPVRRGRKHKFGIVCITHRPSDISPAVENLCNTKIAFRSSGCKTWISNNFGKDYVYDIETLETGNCYVSTMKTSRQIQVKISVPHVGLKENENLG